MCTPLDETESRMDKWVGNLEVSEIWLTWLSYYGHVGQVKVKTADLKANLSSYVRKVRETGEPVEILLREEAVAYLTPICGEKKQTVQEIQDVKALEHDLAEIGLTCQMGRTGSKPSDVTPAPVVAGDGRKGVNTIEAIRSEKDW